MGGGLQGATWQQAVQWMEEVEVEAGQNLPLIARHDTYGISFGRESVACASVACASSPTQGAARTAAEEHSTPLPASGSSPTEPASAAACASPTTQGATKSAAAGEDTTAPAGAPSPTEPVAAAAYVAASAPSTTQGATGTAAEGEGTTLPAGASSPTEPADVEPYAAGVLEEADVSPAAEDDQPMSRKQDVIQCPNAVRTGVPMQVLASPQLQS